MKNLILIGAIFFASKTVAQPQTTLIKSSEGKTVYTITEKMPQYPGGEEAMKKFLAENIKYPAAAKEQKIEGTVFLQFVINDLGWIIDAKVIRPLHEDLDKEALRVLQLMPDWIPGQQNGKNVTVQYFLPVKFMLSTEKK